MERILVSTVVYRSPTEVFPYLRSFTDYPRYTAYLEEVVERDSGPATARADGGTGSRYDLRFSWWKLSYTARSAVTDVREPQALSWRLVSDVDARGEWRVESAPEAAQREGTEAASRIYFEAVYDPHSADPNALSLPRFVSLEWVIGTIRPKLLEEAERVVSRLVAAIEGESRPVELAVHETPG